MKTTQKIAHSLQASFQLTKGIDSISHMSITESIMLTSDELSPASLADIPRLTSLFPLKSYDDFILERLTPKFQNLSFLRPERFRSTLTLLKFEIRYLGKQRYQSSKRYGRLAQILDDQDELNKLAQMYFSSLLQG